MGPSRSHTVITADAVFVTLRDGLTKGERTLCLHGAPEAVRDVRRAFHDVMSNEVVAGVERIMGRRVVAHLGDQSTVPDAAVVVFLLADR